GVRVQVAAQPVDVAVEIGTFQLNGHQAAPLNPANEFASGKAQSPPARTECGVGAGRALLAAPLRAFAGAISIAGLIFSIPAGRAVPAAGRRAAKQGSCRDTSWRAAGSRAIAPTHR